MRTRTRAPREQTCSFVIAAVVCVVMLDARTSSADVEQPAAAVAGVVADDTGAPIAQATVTLTNDAGVRIEVATGDNGRFSLANVPPGTVELTVAAHGFAEQKLTIVAAAEAVTNVPEIRLRVAVSAVSIEVTPSVEEVAERQIAEQEQQRVFGVVPNFFITFLPDAAPLNTRQKFQLSWKTRTDPTQFAFVAFVAAVQQLRNDYSGFGDGASGYAKRYAAAYATAWTSSLMNRVVMPTIFRQDPRYFYKGTGTTKSRVAYAMSRSVIRKGDNGRWQPNYSGIVGTIAAAAISNYYYPKEDRRGARLILTNTALGIGGSAAGHLAQEFLYARFTTRRHDRAAK